jgi:hypothetical protein
MPEFFGSRKDAKTQRYLLGGFSEAGMRILKEDEKFRS